jgi:hypothetical protein
MVCIRFLHKKGIWQNIVTRKRLQNGGFKNFFGQKFGSKPLTPIFALPKREKLSPKGKKDSSYLK